MTTYHILKAAIEAAIVQLNNASKFPGSGPELKLELRERYEPMIDRPGMVLTIDILEHNQNPSLVMYRHVMWFYESNHVITEQEMNQVYVRVAAEIFQYGLSNMLMILKTMKHNAKV